MQRYAVIETATNKVRNIIMWDGVTPYDPGAGYTLRLAAADDVIDEDA